MICEDSLKDRLMKVAAGQRNGIIVTDMNYHEHFNYVNFPNNQLQFTKDSFIHLYSIFYYSSKSIVLRRKFNSRIRLLQMHGLIDRYQDMFRGMKRNVRRKKAKKLRFHRIAPIFSICGSLCVISFFVFLLELCAHKFAIVKRVLEYLTY